LRKEVFIEGASAPAKYAALVLMPVTIWRQIMTKSNLFHVSLMYCFQPRPCHLTMNSML
jgi:hypothetical protein